MIWTVACWFTANPCGKQNSTLPRFWYTYCNRRTDESVKKEWLKDLSILMWKLVSHEYPEILQRKGENLPFHTYCDVFRQVLSMAKQLRTKKNTKLDQMSCNFRSLNFFPFSYECEFCVHQTKKNEVLFPFQEILFASKLCYPDLAPFLDVFTVIQKWLQWRPLFMLRYRTWFQLDIHVHNVKNKKSPTILFMLDNNSIPNGRPVWEQSQVRVLKLRSLEPQSPECFCHGTRSRVISLPGALNQMLWSPRALPF